MTNNFTDTTGRTASGIAIASIETVGAPPALRARLTLDRDDAERIARSTQRSHPDLECVVIATCNRTELVVAGDRADAALAIRALHEGLGVSDASGAPCLETGVHPTVHVGDDAVDHLFHVACGLKSQLVGEVEILGQLRRAWNDAERLGTAGPLLRSVFRDSFALGKRARTTTAISHGGAGLGTAVSTAIAGRSGLVLIIGAGDAGRTVARRVAKSGRPVVIANRTIERAQDVADEVAGRAIGLHEVTDIAATAEVIVSAVSGNSPIISTDVIRRIREHHPGWSPLLIDLGTGSAIEATLRIDVVALDDLAERHREVAERRAAAIPDVEREIARALARHRSRRQHPAATRGFFTTAARSETPHDFVPQHRTQPSEPSKKEHEQCVY